MELIKSLTIGQIVGSIVSITALISVFVEASSVFKSQPITKFLGWMGSKLNAETNKQVSELKKRIDKIETDRANDKAENAENKTIERRIRILQFGDEVRRGVKHSQESYNQVLDDIHYYSKYCTEHPEFKNDRTVMTTQKIKEMYAQHMDRNDFL